MCPPVMLEISDEPDNPKRNAKLYSAWTSWHQNQSKLLNSNVYHKNQKSSLIAGLISNTLQIITTFIIVEPDCSSGPMASRSGVWPHAQLCSGITEPSTPPSFALSSCKLFHQQGAAHWPPPCLPLHSSPRSVLPPVSPPLLLVDFRHLPS